MAAYKTDINLFKAAGGERAKSKQVSKTKRLMVVVLLVVILLAGAVAGSLYYSSIIEAKLKVETKRATAYENTMSDTRDVLATLNDVNRQIVTQNAIEFAYSSNMWTPGVYSDMSETELSEVSTHLQQTAAYTNEIEFDYVIRDVLAKINQDRYTQDSYEARFLYSALYYMQTMEQVFMFLPKNENNYWYCYYRGKVVMFLKAKGDVAGDPEAMVAELQNLSNSPFSTVVPEGNQELAYKYFSVTIEGDEGNETYLALALNSKTVFERFLDTVESVFADHNVNDGIAYHYSARNFSILDKSEDETVTVLFNVTFSMDQSENFHLKDVCDALYATPFFANDPNYAFEDSDNHERVEEKTLQFVLVNKAVEAIHDPATAYFIPTDNGESAE